MFYFIFVARMLCFCPIATISFRTSCQIRSDGMKNHFCMSHRAWKTLY